MDLGFEWGMGLSWLGPQPVECLRKQRGLPEQHRLAAATWPKDDKYFAGVEVESDAFERFDSAIALA